MKTTTLRLDDELHDTAKLVGQIDGEVSFNSTVEIALHEYILRRRKNPRFQKKLKEHMRLAQP